MLVRNTKKQYVSSDNLKSGRLTELKFVFQEGTLVQDSQATFQVLKAPTLVKK